MAGEIIRTEGIVLRIRPWSRTSHVVTWLTPDRGPVTTLVKGAVRPKSAFLGQYDLFYTCELLYYARATGELHALREVTPRRMRESLRGDWRATALAAYAADLEADLAPASDEALEHFAFLSRFLDDLTADPTPFPGPWSALIRLETGILARAGLAPDFSGLDPSAPWTPFAVDRGQCGEGRRTVRLAPSTVAALRGTSHENEEDAVRFLGLFLAYHLERPADVRRSLVTLLSAARP